MGARGGAAAAFRAVLANGSLRRALLAFLAFNAAEQGVWIAVIVFAYGQGGATTAGLVAVAQLVPAMVVAPFGSTLGDRIRRDRALALGYATQALSLAALAVALASRTPFAVYAIAVVASCAVTLTRPVHHALLPEVSETPGELGAAFSASATVEGIGLLVGPLANSVLIVLSGPGAVCALFACTSLGAAFLTIRLHVLATADDAPAAPSEGLTEGLILGLNELRYDPPAGLLAFLGGAQFFVVGLLDVFYPLLAIDVLSIGEGGAGVLCAAVGIGGLLGAGATAVLVGRRRLVGPIELGIMVSGGAFAAIAISTTLGATVGLLALVGAARSFFDVSARTLLQRSVRGDIVARVFGLQEALIMASLAAGSGAAPVLVAWFGSRSAFTAAGAAIVGAGVVALPFLRRLDDRADLPDPARVALLRGLPPFGLLPAFTLERAVRHLEAVRASAGTEVIVQGERGDRFYAIEAGEAVVEHDGRELARLGAGGYFGEIALLRNVPRTATVRAVTDLDLLALPRRAFLGAVTGIRPSAEAANAEADRRLREQVTGGSGSG